MNTSEHWRTLANTGEHWITLESTGKHWRPLENIGEHCSEHWRTLLRSILRVYSSSHPTIKRDPKKTKTRGTARVIQEVGADTRIIAEG